MLEGLFAVDSRTGNLRYNPAMVTGVLSEGVYTFNTESRKEEDEEVDGTAVRQVKQVHFVRPEHRLRFLFADETGGGGRQRSRLWASKLPRSVG